MGSAFAASVERSFNLSEHQASSLESGGHHIYKQIWWSIVGEILTLEREEGYNHDNSLSVFPSMLPATVLGHVL